MKIGVLVTGHPPADLMENGTYDKYFERLLDGHGFSVQGWMVVDGEFPDSVADADGWLITGSRHGVYEDHDWIPRLEEFIREIHASGRPLIGICFGHQIIAQALGGRVEKYPGGWSIGPTSYPMGGREYVVNAWHQDQVVEKPAEAEVISSTDFCKYAGLAYGDTIWTFQPHPEYDNDFLSGLIEKRGKGVVPEPLMAAAREKLAAATDRMDVAQIMADFFKKERA